MKFSLILCALVSLFLSYLLILINALQHPDFFNHTCFNDKGTYTSKSGYHTNLNMLLSNFSSDTENYFGFYNSYYGESPNTVNGLALCRGDTQLHACQSCIKNATTLLPKLCPNQKEAFLYYDLCILRYSNASILGMYQNPEFSYTIHSPEKAKDAKYKDALDDLMMRLKSKASSGDSLSKVAVGNVTADENESVYGLVQCTPDLTQQDCDDCLVKAISEIQGCCKDKIGGRVIKLSCNLRFDNVMFYNPAVVLPIQSPSAVLATAPSPVADPPKGVADPPKGVADSPISSPSKGNSNRTSRIVVMMAVAIVAFTTLKETTAIGL